MEIWQILFVAGLCLVCYWGGWAACLLVAGSSEREWREDYERRKQRHLKQVRQAFAEAETDDLRLYYKSLEAWIENDYRAN